MAIIEYPTSEPVRSARARYFEANHFGADGGYGDAWVEVKFGPIPVPIPNTEARVRAVRYHDLHHIVTGYDTDLVGEMEISAWELGAGCEDFVAAYVLNVGGLSGGAAIAPNGRPFTADSIGQALAQRSIMEHVRSTGEITGGPKPFASTDRSRFLQALDEAVNRERRKAR